MYLHYSKTTTAYVRNTETSTSYCPLVHHMHHPWQDETEDMTVLGLLC